MLKMMFGGLSSSLCIITKNGFVVNSNLRTILEQKVRKPTDFIEINK